MNVTRLLSTKQVAERWGVNPKTVQRYVADGRLKAIRLGPRLYRVDLGEVERFERRSRTK